MAGKNTSVLGIYTGYAAVERAVDELREAGFRNTDISVLFPANAGTKDFAHEKGTKAPEGATAGGGTGAIVGGALGWLAGIGALAIPGVGPFIAAGPIMAALAGGAVGGAVGGFTGALIGFGMPEYEAKRYEGRIQKGGILLSVHGANRGRRYRVGGRNQGRRVEYRPAVSARIGLRSRRRDQRRASNAEIAENRREMVPPRSLRSPR